jgi:uncharacterized protein (TIGR02270 family)
VKTQLRASLNKVKPREATNGCGPHVTFGVMNPMPIPSIVHQHAEEATVLRHVRSRAVRAPDLGFFQLARLDERIAAHLDGLLVAGRYGMNLAIAGLDEPGTGEYFVAAALAIENRDAASLENVLSCCSAISSARLGVTSAFGWVSAASLRGITQSLLNSEDPFRRQVGIAACGMHRVDPGEALVAALNDADPALRTCALRTAADVGRVELRAVCEEALANADPQCAFEAARAVALLGNRRGAAPALGKFTATPGSSRADALALLLKLQTPTEAHAVLKTLSEDPADIRLLIRGVGIAGDPRYVPWLIQKMQDPKLMRLTGESFSLITGLDLAWVDFEQSAPEGDQTGPTDDPDDDDVAMDEDDGLPWPDAEKIAVWWQANGYRFTEGTRYFMGEPPSPAHCRVILKEGFQRQRIAAAEWLCLLQPGTPLFNTAAPAWRQQRWLARMGG